MSWSTACWHVIASVWLPLASGSSHVGIQGDNGTCFIQTQTLTSRTFTGIEDEEAPISRVAVLLRGESFRHGGQGSRAVGGHAEQLNATQSQLQKLVLPLEHAGMAVDVFSATYNTSMVGELIDKWRGRLRVDERLLKEGSTQLSNAWSVVSASSAYSQKHGLSYDMVIMLRHDMHLKQDLGKMIHDLFTGNGRRFDKFLVPFKMIKNFRWYPDRVPDTLQVMSGKFFPAFQDMLDHSKEWPAENIWSTLSRVIGKEHMGFVEPSFFGDSDPGKAWNPLYKFAGRGEGKLMPQELLAYSSQPKPE